jgi:transposase
MLPKEFPPWKTVYGHLRKLRNTGVLEEMMATFRQEVRKNMSKNPSPSVGIIDSQSVKSRSGKKNI